MDNAFCFAEICHVLYAGCSFFFTRAAFWLRLHRWAPRLCRKAVAEVCRIQEKREHWMLWGFCFWLLFKISFIYLIFTKTQFSQNSCNLGKIPSKNFCAVSFLLQIVNRTKLSTVTKRGLNMIVILVRTDLLLCSILSLCVPKYHEDGKASWN